MEPPSAYTPLVTVDVAISQLCAKLLTFGVRGISVYPEESATQLLEDCASLLKSVEGSKVLPSLIAHSAFAVAGLTHILKHCQSDSPDLPLVTQVFRLIFTLDEIAADVIMRKPGMIKLIVRRMEKTEPNDHPNAVRVLFDLITVTGVVCNSSENIGTLILEEGHDTLRRIAVCPCMPFSLSSKALRCIECIEWTWENEQMMEMYSVALSMLASSEFRHRIDALIFIDNSLEADREGVYCIEESPYFREACLRLIVALDNKDTVEREIFLIVSLFEELMKRNWYIIEILVSLGCLPPLVERARSEVLSIQRLALSSLGVIFSSGLARHAESAIQANAIEVLLDRFWAISPDPDYRNFGGWTLYNALQYVPFRILFSSRYLFALASIYNNPVQAVSKNNLLTRLAAAIRNARQNEKNKTSPNEALLQLLTSCHAAMIVQIQDYNAETARSTSSPKVQVQESPNKNEKRRREGLRPLNTGPRYAFFSSEFLRSLPQQIARIG